MSQSKIQKNLQTNLHLISSVNEVAYAEGLSTEDVFSVLEYSLKKANSKKYGRYKTHVHIDRKNGSINVERRFLVVQDSEDTSMPDYVEEEIIDESGDYVVSLYDDKIHLSDAKKNDPDVKVGDIIVHDMPDIDINYVSALFTRHNIFAEFNKVRRRNQFRDYKNRVNDLVVGVVSRVEKGSLIVDINGTEAFLPARNVIKGEIFRPGDRVKALIESVTFSLVKSQIILSRTHNQFLYELMKQEIAEIYDGIIKIKFVVRDPGSRAKVAVFSTNKDVDPVGACIGIKGSRINAISSDINGEKIDVVEYSSDKAKFVMNIFSSANILKVVIDDIEGRIDIVVPKENLSMVIGRKGQNIQLASSLIGSKINVLSEEEASQKKLKEFYDATELLVKALEVEEVLAQILITEGFKTVEQIYEAKVENLSCIEGFDYDLASALYERAAEYLSEKEQAVKKSVSDLNISEDMFKLPHLDTNSIIELAQNDVKSAQDVANLSRGEFLDIMPKIDEKKVDDIILFARSLVKMV